MADSSTLVDRVKIFVESSGTGPFQLGNALPSFRGSEALTDGLTYSYAVESGSDYEVGQGVYVLAVDQLLRAPTLSSNGGAPVAFPANVAVNFTALAADLVAGLAGSGTVTSVQASGGTTGLEFTGGPITGFGTLVMDGVLSVANGGTGGADAASARVGIGLGNVNNTSDANKPVSTATQTALDAKVSASDLAGADGSEGVGFTQSGTGGITRTTEAKSRDVIDLFDFIPVVLQDGIRAGTSSVDISGYFQAAADEAAARGGATINAQAGKYIVRANVNIFSGTEISGVRGGTVFSINNDHRLFTLGAEVQEGNVFRNFTVICEDAPADTVLDEGLIQRDRIDGSLNGLDIEYITFDTANAGFNNVYIKARDVSPCHNVRHRFNRHLSSGRMGFEIVQQVDDDPSYVTGLIVEGNYFNDCGGLPDSTWPFQCSLSGAMESPQVLHNTFDGVNHGGVSVGLELVGYLVNPLVSGNIFRGEFDGIISNTSNVFHKGMVGAVITGTVSNINTKGRFLFAAAIDSLMFGNQFVSDATDTVNSTCLYFVAGPVLGETTRRNKITNNVILANAAVAVQFESSPDNQLMNNPLISTAPAASSPYTIVTFGAGSTGNVVQYNGIKRTGAGAYVDNVGGGGDITVGGNVHDGVQQSLPALTGSKTHDFGSIPANSFGTSTTVTVTGATVGLPAIATLSTFEAGLLLHAIVSAADTVTVTPQNITGSAIDPASATLSAVVT